MLDLIADIRKEYLSRSFTEAEADKSAIAQFETWWKEAVASNIIEPNAMTLATASADGLPSARIVLLKGFNAKGFVFFTNYNSYKAKQLEENPRACLVFFWKELERQVRITGIIGKLSEGESDDYFDSRPEQSRISAIASPQSQVISSREWLESQVKKVSDKLEGRQFHRYGPSLLNFGRAVPAGCTTGCNIRCKKMENGGWRGWRRKKVKT